jgi:hypothetical protein
MPDPGEEGKLNDFNDQIREAFDALNSLNAQLNSLAEAAGAAGNAMGQKTVLEKKNAILTKEWGTKYGEVQRILVKVNKESKNRVQALLDEQKAVKAMINTARFLGEDTKKYTAAATKLGQSAKSVALDETAEMVKSFSVNAGVGATANLVKAIGAIKSFMNAIKMVQSIAAAFGKSLGGVATGGILIVIMAVLSAVERLFANMKNGAEISKSFAGTTLRNSASIASLTKVLMINDTLMARLGVTAEELAKNVNVLTQSYALSTGGAQRLGYTTDSYIKAAMTASIHTLAMAKAIGMSDEQTGQMMSTMGLLGEDLSKSNEIFARMAYQANQAGLNVNDLVNATNSLTSANIFATGSMMKTSRSLAGFAQSVMESNNALLNGSNKAYMAAKAVNAMAEAASKLDIGTIMAFGGALKGFSGTMDQLLAQSTGMNRMDILKQYQGTVAASAPEGSKQLAKTILAQQLGITELNTAMTTAIGSFKNGNVSQAQVAKEMEESMKQGQALEGLAMGQNFLLGGILKTLNQILGTLTGTAISKLIFGGGSRTEAAVPNQAVPVSGRQPGEPASAGAYPRR